jgi:hypothetical protein
VVTHHVRHARGDEENEPDEELSHHVEVVRPLRLLGLHPCAHLVRRTLPRSGKWRRHLFKFNCQAKKKKKSPCRWVAVQEAWSTDAKAECGVVRPRCEERLGPTRIIVPARKRQKVRYGPTTLPLRHFDEGVFIEARFRSSDLWVPHVW